MVYYNSITTLRMLLHISGNEISKLGIYDSIELITRATEIKERFETIILAAPGIINPSEVEPYSKYFEAEIKETTVEEDMEEFKKIMKALGKKVG